MRDILQDVFKVNLPSGAAIAVIQLSDVREVATIILAVVSIISTLIVMRNNLRRTNGK